MLRFLGYATLLILLVLVVVNTHTAFYKCCDLGKKQAQLVRDYVLEPAAEGNDSVNLLTSLCKAKQAQHALRLLSDQAGGTRVLSGLGGHDVGMYSTWLQKRYDQCLETLVNQSPEQAGN